MTRRIIYIKNPSSGSNFRTLGSGGKGAPSGTRPRDAFGQIIGAVFGSNVGGASQSPSAVISAGAGAWPVTGLSNVSGIASFNDWQQAIQGIQLPSFTDFLFDNTIFDDESNWTGELAEMLTQNAYFDPFQVVPNFLSPYNPTGWYIPIDADTIQGAFEGGL